MPTQGDPRIANGNSLARKSAGHDPRDSPGLSRPQRGSILAIHLVENPGFCMARLSWTLPTPAGIDFGNSLAGKFKDLHGLLSATPNPRDSPGFSRPMRGAILAIHLVENPQFCVDRSLRTLNPRDSPGLSRSLWGSSLAIHSIENPGFCVDCSLRTPNPRDSPRLSQSLWGSNLAIHSIEIPWFCVDLSLRTPNPDSPRLPRPFVGIDFGRSFGR